MWSQRAFYLLFRLQTNGKLWTGKKDKSTLINCKRDVSFGIKLWNQNRILNPHVGCTI